ncbi:MAG: aminotransferase class I/II-fold pyridoxal phosphate-dependent enzyme [Clostridia bacterium]|nr:aminotransferase class I/II-fold pyridoxal phosphate-dependent enzyme [Clostridia bacterium]
MNNKGFRTNIIHSGEVDFMKKVMDGVSIPKVAPIFMSSVFSFDDVPTLDKVYDHTADGYVYARMTNPGTDGVCEVLAAAENCDGAVAFSSGMAAIVTSFLAFVESGDHILSSHVLYGGVYDYLKNELSRFGVETTFIDFEKENIEDHIKPNTKIIYTETIVNPLMSVVDMKKVADIAHKHGCKFIIDSTFATPAIVRPIDFGADLVVYSTTKFLSGHSDIIGGAICANKENLPILHKMNTLYGNIMSPFDAWLLARSLKTLEMRVKLHSENALKVAEFFENHPKIEKVYYAGLPSSSYHALAKSQFVEGRCGGMLSADIKGGAQGANDFIAACDSIKFVPSLAGVSTTISYPAKTSHRAYSKDEMDAAGISMGQLRFSIGLENAEDIIAEFEQALKSVK